MKRSTSRNVFLGLLTLLILGGALWIWLGNRTPAEITGNGPEDESSPQDLVSNAAHEAKARAVKFTMDVASMSITGIDGGRIKVVNKVVITNPLPVPLNASRLDYSVSINSIKVGDGSYTQPIQIPASGNKTLSLPMQVMVKPMEKVLKQMDARGKDTATYTFHNIIHTDIPIAGMRKLELNIEEEMPVTRLPKLKPGDIDVKKLGLKNSGMEMTMHITNPNPFSIRMKNSRYTMTIDGKTTMEGAMQQVINLPAKAKTPVTLHMDMKTGQALKMGWKMLFDKKDTRYRMTFDSQIISDEKMLKNSSMHFTEEGKLQDLKKAIKETKE